MNPIKKDNISNKAYDFYKKYDIHESTYSKNDVIDSNGNYIKIWDRD